MTFFPWLDSANGGDGESRWTSFSIDSIGSGLSPSGRDVYRLGSSSSDVMLAFPAQESVVVGCKWWRSSLPSPNSDEQSLQFWSDGSAQLSIGWVEGGIVRVTRGATVTGTLLADSDPGVVSAQTWHDVEVRAVVADVGGRVEVWIDGVQVIDFTGDTRASGSSNIDRVRFGRSRAGANSWHISDIVIDSATEPKGPTLVLDSYPSGDGANTDLSPSPGSGEDNYENVNEAIPDGDATYNFGDTEGLKDTYTLDNPVPEGYEVLAVQVSHYSRKTDSGTRFVRPVIRSGGTDYGGESAPLAESYLTYRDSWTEDPDTSSAWTRSGRNSIEAGVEIRDS